MERITCIFAALCVLITLEVIGAHDIGSSSLAEETEGRSFLGLSRNRFTGKAVTEAPACSDPSGTTGYCLTSAACRAHKGTIGAACPKQPWGTGRCCLVDRCPVAPPAVPAGGVATTSPLPGAGSRLGTEVEYRCRPGLVFDGLGVSVLTSTCDARGNWSPNTIPSCVTAPPTQCAAPPPQAAPGIIVSDVGSRAVGALVYYICEDGTFPDGQVVTAARCGEDGTWSPATLPECVSAPPTACTGPPPTAAANMRLRWTGDLAIGATAVYLCVRNTVLPSGVDFLVATCAPDGTWQPGTVPDCGAAPPTACTGPPPTAAANMRLRWTGDLAIGATAVYLCVRNTVLPSGVDFLVATCAPDGTWQPGTVPDCGTAQP